MRQPKTITQVNKIKNGKYEIIADDRIFTATKAQSKNIWILENDKNQVYNGNLETLKAAKWTIKVGYFN